jgi:dTMP kinase
MVPRQVFASVRANAFALLPPARGGIATPGILIAIEGIDGSGISTQSRALTRWLKDSGHSAVCTKEPTAGPVGQLIRRSLRGQGSAAHVSEPVLAALFAADRLDHLQRVIEPALGRGEIVVCDRYLLSSFAYQSLAVDMDWLRQLNRRARRPDLTLWLTVSPATSRQRRVSRVTDERYESDDHLALVSAQMRDLSRRLSGELHILPVDGEGSVSDVLTRLQAAVTERLR